MPLFIALVLPVLLAVYLSTPPFKAKIGTTWIDIDHPDDPFELQDTTFFTIEQIKDGYAYGLWKKGKNDKQNFKHSYKLRYLNFWTLYSK